MKKSQLLILAIFVIPCILVFLNDRGISDTIEDNIGFKDKLSDYGLFQGDMAKLIPYENAEIFELGSTLFTDYASKQRFILLPAGQKMKALGNDLPDFPDGTILVKTFFYPNTSDSTKDSLHIVETRLLIKTDGQWNAATYQWNSAQDEAYWIKEGAVVPVHFIDATGKERTTGYTIPSRSDCSACHRQKDKIFPIGPKLRNMNLTVHREQKELNQLAYFQQKGKLEIQSISSIEKAIDYHNLAEPLERRARIYLDINCAHCHQPNGIAYITQLDVRWATPIHETGIWLKQGKIAHRITTKGELHMPKIGTTIGHEEGIKLILDYLNNLDSNDKK